MWEGRVTEPKSITRFFPASATISRPRAYDSLGGFAITNHRQPFSTVRIPGEPGARQVEESWLAAGHLARDLTTLYCESSSPRLFPYPP
jgi:hypothetical protein